MGSSSLTISNHLIHLHDILHVPKFSKNILSLSRLLQDNPNLTIEFSSSCCSLKDPRTKTTLLQVTCSRGLYFIPLPFRFLPQAHLGLRVSADTWHARLGHPSSSVTLQVWNSNTLPCTSNKLALCHDCCMAKSHHLPFYPSLSTTSSPLDLIHSVGCLGPLPNYFS